MRSLIRITVFLIFLYGVISFISQSEGSPNAFQIQTKSNPPNLLLPDWSKSYQLYGQPHAIWLTEDNYVGANRASLDRALKVAEERKQVPEFVMYAIPNRDMGQSSAGGFNTWDSYLKENQLIANRLKDFVQDTGIRPVIYLEPDSMPHAAEAYRDLGETILFKVRTRHLRSLVILYKEAGAKVYLGAGHSGWFDYGEKDIKAMAHALNAAGIELADGIMTNVSNRQKVGSINSRSEVRYIHRLLPHLKNPRPEVVIDTSRNGGVTHPRVYRLKPDGTVSDNENSAPRIVGSWKETDAGEVLIKPFYGRVKSVAELVSNEQYAFDRQTQTLTAPQWLDPVSDPVPGPAPTDQTGISGVSFRFIKPPDECDGSLNCPPGESRSEIHQKTLAHFINRSLIGQLSR